MVATAEQLAVLGGQPAITLDQTEAARWPIVEAEENAAVQEVLASGQLSTSPAARQLEEEFAAYLGCATPSPQTSARRPCTRRSSSWAWGRATKSSHPPPRIGPPRCPSSTAATTQTRSSVPSSRRERSPARGVGGSAVGRSACKGLPAASAAWRTARGAGLALGFGARLEGAGWVSAGRLRAACSLCRHPSHTEWLPAPVTPPTHEASPPESAVIADSDDDGGCAGADPSPTTVSRREP